MTGEEKREPGVSRREAVKTGTFATAGLLGLSSLGAESARAQSSEPRIRLGDEWVIDPDGDDFSIEHSSLGVSFVWDESVGYWVPGGGGFDMDGGDIVDDGTTVWDSSESQVGDGSTSADHQSVDTDSLVIGGELYTLDGTLDGSGAQEHTYSMNTNADRVIVEVQRFTNEAGASQELQLRVNGDTGQNYDYMQSGSTTPTTATEWPINAVSFSDTDGMTGSFELKENVGFGITFDNALYAGGRTDAVTHGGNGNVTAPVSSFTLRGESGNVAVKARVYRRVMNI